MNGVGMLGAPNQQQQDEQPSWEGPWGTWPLAWASGQLCVPTSVGSGLQVGRPGEKGGQVTLGTGS